MSPEDVEDSVCTELLQKWGTTGSSSVVEHPFQPVPLSEFCHLPKRKQGRVWDKEVPDDVLVEVKKIIYEDCTGRCMVREAEIGQGTSIHEHVDNPGPVDVLPYHDEAISYIFSRIGEENISCGCDEEFIMSMPQQILEFYLMYISVSLQDIQKVYFKTLGQNNFIWHKERQVCITGYSAHKYEARMNSKTTWESRCRSPIIPEKPFRGTENTKYETAKEVFLLHFLRATILNLIVFIKVWDMNEPVSLKLFAEGMSEHKIQINFGFCINFRMPAFGYSPDGIMDEEVLLEVKSLAVGKKLAGADLAEQLTKKPKILEKTESGSFILRKESAFYTQIQFGLAVLDFQMGKLILYFNSTAEGVVVIDVPWRL